MTFKITICSWLRFFRAVRFTKIMMATCREIKTRNVTNFWSKIFSFFGRLSWNVTHVIYHSNVIYRKQINQHKTLRSPWNLTLNKWKQNHTVIFYGNDKHLGTFCQKSTVFGVDQRMQNASRNINDQCIDMRSIKLSTKTKCLTTYSN